MCLCTPNKRTPFCGRPGCEWPEPAKREIYCAACEISHDEPECAPVPSCDICDRICKVAELRTYRSKPFDPRYQAPLSLCPDCYNDNS